MITPEKIDEWIREVEERPSSASLIIRFIGNRLIDLTKWNEELRAENLALCTEKKVEEYEERITTLEYQLGLLKRQLGVDIDLIPQPMPISSSPSSKIHSLNILIYQPQGQVLRIEKLTSELVSGNDWGHFSTDIASSTSPLRLLAVNNHEELLLAFDSGRTVTMPIASIQAADPELLDWQRAFLQAPLGTEELAFIHPVARMALHEFCIQVSRKGCIKKIKESLFESYLGKSYIGTGIKSPPDKTFGLVLAGKDTNLILVSKEGYLICLGIEPLPTTIEEVLRLSITDHIIAAFTAAPGEAPETSVLFVSQNGKVIQRKPEWLEISSSFKTKGQAVFSQERRDAGIRLVGAALVKDEDWGIALCSNGKLVINKIGEMIGVGTLLSKETDISILGFTTFRSGF